MGRTIHYRTQDSISKEKFELLSREIEKINSRETWNFENLKIWHGGIISNKIQAWGFTKVKDDAGADLVLKAMKKISSKNPGITWIIFDEGKPDLGKLYFRDGNILDSK